MKRNLINAVIALCLFTASVFAACGSGVNGADNLITDVGWYFENTAPDYSNNNSTCSLIVFVHYRESIAANQIESFSITAPTGWRWTVGASDSEFGGGGSGKPYVAGRLLYGENPKAFPLGGVWTAEIRLRNGMTSSFQLTFHEPGSSSDAIRKYLYTKEDWTPAANQSDYIAALGRFPSEGYTVQYSSLEGGKITTTGLSAVRAVFLEAEPTAYNMFCWLFDVDRNYLGYTSAEYSTVDHSPTNLITADGELLISPSTTTAQTGQVDLSRVKYIRFVYNDGAQFAPQWHWAFDYRSISSLVPVVPVN
jgi:hypothetical protein